MPLDTIIEDVYALKTNETTGTSWTRGVDTVTWHPESVVAEVNLIRASQTERIPEEQPELQQLWLYVSSLLSHWSSNPLMTLVGWVSDTDRTFGVLSGSGISSTLSMSRNLQAAFDAFDSLFRDAFSKRLLQQISFPSEEVTAGMIFPVDSSQILDGIAGPFHDSEGLTEWLGVTEEDLRRRVLDRTILGCPTEDDGDVYPAWQFDENGNLLPGLTDVMRVLFGATDDSWQVAIWLSSPSDLLKGKSPREWLQQSSDADVVLELATKTAARWHN
jgi:hypothetical protein